MSGGLLGVLFHVVPIALSGRSRQHTNLYEKWPPEAISQQVAHGTLHMMVKRSIAKGSNA